MRPNARHGRGFKNYSQGSNPSRVLPVEISSSSTRKQTLDGGTMQVQILNSFKGDDVRKFDTSDPESRGTAAKLIADLLKTGSALFLEREVGGKMYTYRVAGYDEQRDKIKLVLHPDEIAPPDSVIPPTRRRGRPKGISRGQSYGRTAYVTSDSGQVVSVAPVSGGVDTVEEAQATHPLEGATWRQLRWMMGKVCEDRGWHHGCPMPSGTNQTNRLIVAKGAPLHEEGGGVVDFSRQPRVHVCSTKDVDEDAVREVNSWSPRPTEVRVFRDSRGSYGLRLPKEHLRLKVLMDTLITRAGSLDAETEITAMMSLRQKINDNQWESYILCGAFPETSTRSGVTYVIRKGLPTIAIKEKVNEDGTASRHFLASLCLHPLGYYEHTFAGCQPPTDDAIAHLMLIRADEHRFWKKAGQHSLDSLMSGI